MLYYVVYNVIHVIPKIIRSKDIIIPILLTRLIITPN